MVRTSYCVWEAFLRSTQYTSDNLRETYAAGYQDYRDFIL